LVLQGQAKVVVALFHGGAIFVYGPIHHSGAMNLGQALRSVASWQADVNGRRAINAASETLVAHDAGASVRG
jgi:hypothetical protein